MALSLRLPALNFRRRIALLVWLRRLMWVPAVLAFWFTQAAAAFWLTAVLSLVLAALVKARESSLRRQFVREADLPRFLIGKLCAAHPHLSARDAELVLQGLRQFFLAHLRSGRRFVAMPSQVVDTAWHAFILHTQGYQRWCHAAFGRFLHHSPAEVLGRDAGRNDGLRRSWYWACKEEGIDPRDPSRLPLLFALDTKLAIAGGFSYVPDCRVIDGRDASPYCGSSFGSSDSGAGDAGGFGGCESTGADGSSSGSDGAGSSGDSGSGCGGGCGGGGGGGD